MREGLDCSPLPLLEEPELLLVPELLLPELLPLPDWLEEPLPVPPEPLRKVLFVRELVP